MDWRELYNELAQRQTGELPDSGFDLGFNDIPQSDGDDYKKALFAKYGFGTSTPDTRKADTLEYAADRVDTDLYQLGESVGYGDNRRDWRVPVEEFAKNPVDYRANAQSQGAKIINGLIKAVPTYATTVLDNTIGQLAGLLNVAIDEDTALTNEGRSFADTPFAEKMQDIRDKMEEWFPNYRTQQEMDDADKWWKHLNGNFWGDVFLKNLGFTLGAGTSFKLYGGLFRLSQGKVVNEAYKAAVTAAANGGSDIDAFRKILQGASVENIPKMYREFGKISKKFNRLNWESQLIGSLGGAVGEARTEAINAAREFRDEQLADIYNDYSDGQRELLEELYSNEGYWMQQPVYDGFGNIIDYETVLNENGTAYRDAKLQELRDNMAKAQGMLNSESERLANNVFWLNVPLLAGSNAVMFGKMFSGGFRTQSNARFRGEAGNLRGVGSRARAIGYGVRNAVTEGMEELTQKVFSEGQKDISKQNMASFYNDKYDIDGIHGVAEWLLSMLDSAGDVVRTGSSWEEFAVGLLTGGIGHVANFQRGRDGKITWNPVGGVYGGYKEGMRERDENRALAEKLNEKYNDPEFQDLLTGMIRHKKYDALMDAALGKNDKFVWKSEEEKQLMSDIMMFARAGRLNDITGYVDAFSRLNEDDVHELRDMFQDDTDKEFENKTDKEILEWIQERAKQVSDGIKQYRDFSNSVELLAMGTTDQDVLDEYIFTASQLENFEKRYQKLSKEVWEKIRPRVEVIANRKTKKGEPTKDAKAAQELLSNETSAQRIFGSLAMDIHDRDATGDNPIQNMLAQMSQLMDDAHVEQVLNTLEKWKVFAKGNENLKQDVKDLQRLVRARQSYYAKLFDPSFRKKFEEEKKPVEDVTDKLDKHGKRKAAEANIAKLKGAKTLKDFVRAYASLDPADEEQAKIEDELIAADPTLSSFMKMMDGGQTFIESLRKDISDNSDAATEEDKPVWEAIASVMNDLKIEDAIASSEKDEDPVISIGRKLLQGVAGNERAEQLVRKMLEDRLKDVATAHGLGVMPKKPGKKKKKKVVGGKEDDGETDDGGDEDENESSKQLSEALSKLAKVSDKNSKWLNKILDGDFSDYPDLTDADKLKLLTEAAKKRNELNGKGGTVVGGEEEIKTDPKGDEELRKRFERRKQRSVDGSPFSVENILQARQGRRILHHEDPEKSDSADGVNATLDWLREHRVHDFVNSGALADIADVFAAAGKQLPIYFIANPHVSSDPTINPFAINGGKKEKFNEFGISLSTFLLAIDMDETIPGKNQTIREYLRKYNTNDNVLFSSDTLVDIQEGNATHGYQVIGEIKTWPNDHYGIAKNATAEQVSEALPLNEKRSRLMWEHAIKRSIFPQYYNDIKPGGVGSLPETGRWYVARIHPHTDTNREDADYTTGKKMYTTLNYIMPGRKETMPAERNAKAKKTKLSEALTEYLSRGKKYHLALITKEGPQTTQGSPAFPEGSISAPLGSLWIATQNADNSWSWDHVSITRISEFNLDDTKNSSIAKEFQQDMKTIFDDSIGLTETERRQKFEDKLAAIRSLDEMFYLGTGNTFELEYDNGRIMLRVAGERCYDADAVKEALVAKEFRFQITTADIDNKNTRDFMIKEGLLESDLRSFTRIATNIGVNPIADRDADNNQVDVYPIGSNEPIRMDMSGTTASMSPGRFSNTVRLGEHYSFRLNPDNTVTNVATGEVINNQNVVAIVKVGSELLELERNEMLDSFETSGGKRWVVHNTKNGFPLQHTELYEKTIGDIRVRFIRHGENGAFMLQYDNEDWDFLMEVAERMEKKDENDYLESNEVMDDAAILDAYDEAMAKEAGGKAVKKGEKKKPKKGSTVLSKDEIKQRPKKDVAKAVQDDSNDLTEDECVEL